MHLPLNLQEILMQKYERQDFTINYLRPSHIREIVCVIDSTVYN